MKRAIVSVGLWLACSAAFAAAGDIREVSASAELSAFLNSLGSVKEAATAGACSVTCGGSALLACPEGVMDCRAVERNCSIGQRGYLTCDGSTTLCPACPATCTASCGSSGSLSCPGGTSTCTSQNQNCEAGARGYITCNGSTTYCPACCQEGASIYYDAGCCPDDRVRNVVHQCINGVWQYLGLQCLNQYCFE